MESIITPKKLFFQKKKEIFVTKKVYIIFSKKLALKIMKKFSFTKEKFTRGDIYIEKNKNFSIVTNFGVGFSSALMLAEELSFFGFEEVISVGISGFFKDDKKNKIGDIFLVDKIFTQIDLSEIYSHGDFLTTSKKTNNFILDKINLNKKNIISVVTIYKESTLFFEKSIKKNISCVDMETFPLSLVFQENKINFSTIISVSDILSKDGWNFKDENIKKCFNELEKVFLKIEK